MFVLVIRVLSTEQPTTFKMPGRSIPHRRPRTLIQIGVSAKQKKAVLVKGIKAVIVIRGAEKERVRAG